MRKLLTWMGIAIASPILGLGLYLAFLQVSGNFHEILPGQLYRSAQPTPNELANYIQRYGIKTVINLRGPSERKWYRDEVATTSKLSVQHVDFQMSATRQLSAQESENLVALLKDAPKPVLIHCRAGADRTGLASVIYLQQVAGVNEETAEWQLSPLYGHVNLPFLRAYAMDRTWLRLEEVLGIEES
ncbi:protein tyrosine phosphatase [Neorhizobium lilium]|uniref:Protein tyrosine phosphatase n=1 Tax=Neorhizobium lilium TaxID=2503024 RepID=A0A444LEZ2_9HYPH|nr:dual specificity protein phosphatase family protein [Neorhizobium lilium]RWX76671.1 protein tyrosine phosphatase [Neorhizobium lilium]